MLSPDLREAAQQLIATGRIRAEADPERYKAAISGRKELARFFQAEFGWPVDTLEMARLIRLHKRRIDPPADRGPRLLREGRAGPLAPAGVMVLETLICEQLWRRPRISLRELLQAIAQVCAAEARTGRLPTFRVVAGEGTPKKEAQQNRQHLIDALKLLVAEGSITVDADLDRAANDGDSDLVVTAFRDRLAAKFSSLSPTLLGLGDLPPELHAAALSADFLAEEPASADASAAMTVHERRLQALRRLVDDPAADPVDDESEQVPYLHTISGRERALTVAASLGLGITVRRDWWEVTDPSGLASGIDFPNGRRTERQAALALLAIAEIIVLLAQAAYEERLPALARAAAAELVSVRLLVTDPGQPDRWLPTPGIHLWRARVRQPQPGPALDGAPGRAGAHSSEAACPPPATALPAGTASGAEGASPPPSVNQSGITS